MKWTDEFAKMITEEADAWTPSDDEQVCEMEGLLTEAMLSSGVVRDTTSAALSHAAELVSTAGVNIDVDRLLSRTFGAMMRESREAKSATLEELARDLGLDCLTLGRIEAGRANPSVVAPGRLADWLSQLSVAVADTRTALLLSLENVNRTSLGAGTSFARSSETGGRGRALSRTEANEYFERLVASSDGRVV